MLHAYVHVCMCARVGTCSEGFSLARPMCPLYMQFSISLSLYTQTHANEATSTCDWWKLGLIISVYLQFVFQDVGSTVDKLLPYVVTTTRILGQLILQAIFQRLSFFNLATYGLQVYYGILQITPVPQKRIQTDS